MKKLVLIAALITTVSGMTAFGQGWINFTGVRYNVVNEFTTPFVVNTLYTGMDVALYVATVSGTSVAAPAAEGILNGTAVGTTAGSWNANTYGAWSTIMNDGNYQLASDVLASQSVIMGVATGSHGGSFLYMNGGNNNVEMNTAAGITGGGTYEMYAVAWNSAYGATPLAASLAGAPLGWSQEFSYATGGSALATVVATSINQFAVLVPEPSTIALAGLGGLSMLLFRRRK
jgi:hypothetical protein